MVDIWEKLVTVFTANVYPPWSGYNWVPCDLFIIGTTTHIAKGKLSVVYISKWKRLLRHCKWFRESSWKNNEHTAITYILNAVFLIIWSHHSSFMLTLRYFLEHANGKCTGIFSSYILQFLQMSWTIIVYILHSKVVFWFAMSNIIFGSFLSP